MLNYSYRLWGFSKRSSQIESHLVTYTKSSGPLHLNVRNSWCYCLVLFCFVVFSSVCLFVCNRQCIGVCTRVCAKYICYGWRAYCCYAVIVIVYSTYASLRPVLDIFSINCSNCCSVHRVPDTVWTTEPNPFIWNSFRFTFSFIYLFISSSCKQKCHRQSMKFIHNFCSLHRVPDAVWTVEPLL